MKVPSVLSDPSDLWLPQHLRHLYAEKVEAGLSPRSVQFMHSVLHRALKEALGEGLLGRNPADQVKAPRPSCSNGSKTPGVTATASMP